MHGRSGLLAAHMNIFWLNPQSGGRVVTLFYRGESAHDHLLSGELGSLALLLSPQPGVASPSSESGVCVVRLFSP